MAVTASGLYVPTWLDIIDATQLAFAPLADTMKIALFTDTITPNFSTDTAYGVAPYDANETSGGSWGAGGYTLASKTYAESATGSAVFDAADVSQATCTVTSAMCGLIYDDTLAGNNAIVLVDFVTAVSTTNGTLTITWTAPGSGGVFSTDLTP